MSLEPTRIRALLFDLDGTLADTDDEYIRRLGQRIRALSFLFPQRDPTPFLRWSMLAAETPMNALMGLPDWLGIDGPLARFADRLADLRGPSSTAHFVLMAGVAALLSNSDHERIRELYGERGFGFETVLMSRAINSRGSARAPVPELLIDNYARVGLGPSEG